jgi:drug/metabolite transporter (DMT)-like permease
MTTSTQDLAAAEPLSSRLALLAGTGTLLLWSGTPIANKIVVAYMSGLTAGVLRSTLAGAAAVLVCAGFRLPFPRAAADRMRLAFSGIASFAAWPVLFSVGIQRSTAGHAALILATIPIMAVLIAAALDRRWPRRGWWLGAAIALAGAVLIVMRRGAAGASTGGPSAVGDLIILVGCLVCAFGYVVGGRLAPRIGSAATTFWGLVLALIVLVPALAAVAPATAWSAIPARGWLAMGWLALFSSVLAYAFWFYALAHGGIGRISSLLLVMPAITLFAAAALLGEAVGAWLLASCVAVVFGTYLAHRHA